MIKLYTQFGEVVICNKDEFLRMVPHESVGPKIDLPYVRPSTGMYNITDNVTMEYSNFVVDLNSDLQFFSNKHFPEQYLHDVTIEMAVNYANIETLYAVIIGKNFYLYCDPVVYEFGGKYQVVSRSFKDVYSCSIEHSGLRDKIKRFKATRLAKKMFPDLLEVDGWLYSC